MISSSDVLRLGIPGIGKAMAAALRDSNLAINAGMPQQAVEDALARLAQSSDPLSEDLGSLSERMHELAQVLADLTRDQQAWHVRPSPAPWRCWSCGYDDPLAKEQMVEACSLPVSVGGALMPDSHMGYGLPIGGVLAVRDAVIPYAVGVDIACRMRISVLDIPWGDFDKVRDGLKEALKTQAMLGVGVKFQPGKILDHEVMALPGWKELPIPRQIYQKAACQLGTSGSGNHFVEFGRLIVPADINEPGLKLKQGEYLALLSHSGSRGAGEAVAEYYSNLATYLCRGMPQELKRLAWLGLGTAEGQEYWESMQLMGRYACANHELIHRRIAAFLGATITASAENHHNFAWKENYGGEELIVHRKGATPAGAGVLGVIPGSMGDCGFIVRGKGNVASYCSCSHGAGRLMSRKQAFNTLDRAKMAEILEDRGITLLSGSLDESPEVYKPIEAVLKAQGDLVDILAKFEPKLVRMAPEYRNRKARGRGKAAQSEG